MTLIKLYDFKSEDKEHEKIIQEESEIQEEIKEKVKLFTIQMFGIGEDEKRYSVKTTYEPWFAVKVNRTMDARKFVDWLKKMVVWKEETKTSCWDKECSCFKDGLKQHDDSCDKMRDLNDAWKTLKTPYNHIKSSYHPNVLKVRRRLDYKFKKIDKEFLPLSNKKKGTHLIAKKKLYMFDGGKKHAFLKLRFKTMDMFRKFRNLWYTYDGSDKRLKKMKYDGCNVELYESTLPPLLRFFHEKELNPSGWIKISKNIYPKQPEEKETKQDVEYEVDIKSIKPILDKEDAVKYRLMAWDIEASSSHGAFPLAKKGWDMFINETIDYWKQKEIIKENFKFKKELLIDLMGEAILGGGSDRISQLYLKKDMNREQFDKFTSKIEWNKMIKMIDASNVYGLCNREKGKNKFGYHKKGLTTYGIFPKVKGDVVTFIGSTFMKYGEKDQYLNHIVSLGDCSDIKEIENRKIISCETEEELLLTWAKLISDEKPEMMIGYNTFGFDWKFIVDRCDELGITEEFLTLLSRNNDENVKKMIVHKEVTVASGTHISTYVDINGIVQLDLYSHYRKEENLESYKLDHVSSHFIGDGVKEYIQEGDYTKIQSKNLMGIKNGDFISFEILGNSTDMYENGKKFMVSEVDQKAGTFKIKHKLDCEGKLRWCLNKDDITLEEMFNGNTPEKRAKIAKYCLQDCNLLHNLMIKCDIMTGFIEFSAICKIPLDFVIQRGQGIKLLSFISYKCGQFNTFMPDLDKAQDGDGYEGAIVLPPKCGFYKDEPVAVNDYSSLYPSCMVSENISHDSKVWTKEYNLNDELIEETGDKDESGNYIYDNMKEYKYVDVKYDTYGYERKTASSAAVKKLKGYKICRYVQFPNNGKAIMPSVLTELLAARKATKKLKAQAKDPFMKSVYDKRQLGIKVVANSLYGQCGARTSSFYDIDIAASTTATGRKLLLYAKRIVEDCYDNVEVDTEFGKMNAKAEYVYGDTDSVFFKFNLTDTNGEKVRGKKALKVTIDLAKEAGVLATKFLKLPHDLEYEKTFMPFLLLSKKKYVGMLYEEDINKCKRKDMGIVLKRRDNAPCVKDSYGGVVDILMAKCDPNAAVKFLKGYLDDMINERIPINKLIITKKLNASYKNPKQIAHKVLADRMGDRDPGNKPSVGSRIPFVYIKTKKKVKLQGDKIEHPDFIAKNKLKPDYEHYITNQIMKPLLQLFGLLLVQLKIFRKQKNSYKIKINGIKRQFKNDYKKCQEKISRESDKRIKKLIFDDYINSYRNNCAGQKSINNFFKKSI